MKTAADLHTKAPTQPSPANTATQTNPLQRRERAEGGKDTEALQLKQGSIQRQAEDETGNSPMQQKANPLQRREAPVNPLQRKESGFSPDDVQAYAPGAGAGMALQLRSKNPSRQATEEYTKQTPGEGAGTTAMTEHHIVPHARLESLKKKMGYENVVDFMPSWDTATVRMMVNLQSGWEESWVDKAGLDINGLAKDNIGLLVQWANENREAEPEDFKKINRSKASWPESFKGGEEPDQGWASAFFEWLPGNIVKGPTNRPHDQGSGDNLDKELIFLLRKMGQAAHAEKAVDADTKAKTFISVKKPSTEQIEEIKKVFQELNAFGYTEYTDEQRGFWEVYKDGFQVKDYGGN